ncbi:MAG: hypothetical protein FWG31_05035 [Oscillospiraceae bacterium]|nr:hypothetical protein [Oscillospiraceae bacterium]
MKKHTIDLSSLSPRGQTLSEMRGGNLWMTVASASAFNRCKPGLKCVHYMELPGRYRLPLRMDITAKIDSPSLHVLVGSGHADFGCHWSENRRLDDICEPHLKPLMFNGTIPMNEYSDITLIYDLKEMQLLVNGEERFYSKREKYIKSPLFAPMNGEGFPIRISCEKRTELDIKSIHITEYDDSPGIARPPAAGAETPYFKGGNAANGKPTFESCIANLPQELKEKITALDEWLRALKPVKFKRQIEKNGNKITYVASDYGFSYAIHPSYDVLYHTLQWYILTQGKPETWGRRKADRMEETLNRLAETDPAFARRMFDNLYECVGGVSGCLVMTPYTFGGVKKVACHGKMRFKMAASEFDDVQRFIEAFNTQFRRL